MRNIQELRRVLATDGKMVAAYYVLKAIDEGHQDARLMARMVLASNVKSEEKRHGEGEPAAADPGQSSTV